MSRKESGWIIKKSSLAVALLLAIPAMSHAMPHPQESAFVESQDQNGDAQARQRAAEAQDAARERKEAEREREEQKREQEQEKVERMDDLYESGRDALEEDNYEQAAQQFAELAKMSGPQADAALYWKAYALNKLAKKDSALASLAELKKRYPQSRWQKDAGALELEVRQSTGQPSKPEAQGDDELKMLAIQGLMNSNPERALPLLEKVLNGTGSPKEKSKALFVIAQSGSPQGREIVGRIARGNSNPDLQRKAVEYLGLFGGDESRTVLKDIYASTSDVNIKRAILKSYMISGDKDRLFIAAKGEKDAGLREEAIRQLGLVHGVNELQQLYQTEPSTEVRQTILQAFFLAGDADKLVSVAQSEKDPELRRTGVRNLGLIHSDSASKALQAIYAKNSDRETREEVLNAFFIQGNAAAIVSIARNEKDPELKKAAVEKLSLMNSKEGTDYLMEILQK